MARQRKAKPMGIKSEQVNEHISIMRLGVEIFSVSFSNFLEPDFYLNILFACFLIICSCKLALIALDFYMLLYP